MRRFLLLLLALPLAACDGFNDDDFTADVVVSAFLGANEPLPPVSVTETSPFLEAYDPDAVGLGDAAVSVTLLAPDGSDESTVRYQPSPNRGQYVPTDAATVLPERTYRLDVEFQGRQITATTTVPPTVEIVGDSEQSVVYGDGNGPGVRVTQSTRAGGRQAAFIGSTRALGASEFEEVTIDGETRYRSIPGTGALLTPIYQRFLDCDLEDAGTLLCDEDPLQDDAVIGTSPVINEASYIDLGDGTIRVEIPFIAFGYYGPYRLTLVSLDQAYQAFVQTQAVQGGGTTLSPGEIPNVTTNVEGGLGVFGSFARVVSRTTILEPTL
ncbi:DUF4249 family protein [Rubrivirga sp.]|uniref:DUF4249 family protein n=1 Tax=Rubrivirga sp. TaxID=1885344 RepID=UPI003C74F282